MNISVRPVGAEVIPLSLFNSNQEGLGAKK